MGKIREILENALEIATSKPVLEKVGKEMVERVKKRTRLGKGVKEPEGRPSNLKSLEDSTKARRRRLKRSGQLTGPRAQPAKSALNRSGKMLDSLDFEVKGDKIEIKLSKEEEKKAEELIKISQDFTFMNLSRPEVNAAVDIIEEELNKKLK